MTRDEFCNSANLLQSIYMGKEAEALNAMDDCIAQNLKDSTAMLSELAMKRVFHLT